MDSTPTADDVAVLPLAGEAGTGRDAEFTAYFTAARQRQLAETAWLLTGDVHRAEELAQQALVKTYVAWSSARRVEPLAYARRVLANARIDTWRRRRREVLTDATGMPDGVGAELHDQVDDRDLLVRALRALGPRQRAVVVLRYVVGLSEQEVAADLGISTGTVKSQASRGLATLREELGGSAGTTPDADRRSR